MVCVSASVNLPLHHKVQKFSSGTGSPGWSQIKGRKMVVVLWWSGNDHELQNNAVTQGISSLFWQSVMYLNQLGFKRKTAPSKHPSFSSELMESSESTQQQLLLLHPFNGLLSMTTCVTSTRKVNHSGFYWSTRRWGGSGISWTICKSFAFCSRQITMPVHHHSVFYRPDALPAAQPTASKHWRHTLTMTRDRYLLPE